MRSLLRGTWIHLNMLRSGHNVNLQAWKCYFDFSNTRHVTSPVCVSCNANVPQTFSHIMISCLSRVHEWRVCMLRMKEILIAHSDAEALRASEDVNYLRKFDFSIIESDGVQILAHILFPPLSLPESTRIVMWSDVVINRRQHYIL